MWGAAAQGAPPERFDETQAYRDIIGQYVTVIREGAEAQQMLACAAASQPPTLLLLLTTKMPRVPPE